MEMKQFLTGPLFANTWVIMIADNSALVIDPGEATAELLDFLHSKDLEKLDIVITHGHFDHIGGIPDLKKAYPNAAVWIHKNDAKYLGMDAAKRHLQDFPELRLQRYVKDWPQDFPAATAFLEDQQDLHGFKVWHTPGHTRGAICLWHEAENVVFTGDTLFHHSFGRTDLCGGDDATLVASMKRLMTLPDACIVHPGHSASTTIAIEKQNQGVFKYFGLV